MNIKSDFPIFANNEGLVYLDSAATTLKPTAVIDKTIEYYTHYTSNVHRSFHPLAEKATFEYENARSIVAKFIGGKTEEVIFSSGSTAASNLLLQNIPNLAGKKGIIISSLAEHHSLLVPLQHSSKSYGYELKLIGIENYNFSIAEFEAILNNHREEIKIIALAAVSNVLGYQIDLKLISNLKNKYCPDAILIIDATQLLGYHEFSLQDFPEIDALFFSGHKILADTGIGVLWAKSKLLEAMEPTMFGGGMINEVKEHESNWTDIPHKFEAGTPPIAQAISIGASINYLNKIGIKVIESHISVLANKILAELKLINGIKINSVPESTNRSGIISFSHNSIHAHDIAGFMATKNIAIRAGHHCTMPLHKNLNLPATARVSLHLYNTSNDIEKLISELNNCVNYFKKL